MRPRCTITRLRTALLAIAIPSSAFAVNVDYEVGVGIEHDDNVNLSENDPIGENILMPMLGFTVFQLGSTIQAAVIGNIEYRDYLDNHFGDEFRSQLAGRLNWSVLPERLDFTVQDRLGVEPVNTLQPDAPSNLQQTNVFAAGPTLRFRFGPTVRGQAELRYVDSYAEETDEFNSQRIEGALRAIKDLDATTAISANVTDQHISFDDASVSPDYNSYGFFGRYARSWTKLDFTADLGYSWLRYSGAGDLDRDSPLFRTDLVWHIAPRDTLTLDVAYEFSDAASGMLAGEPGVAGTGGVGGNVPGAGPAPVVPGPGAVPIQTPIPPDVSLGGATISSAAYLAKTAGLAYSYRGDRWDFTVAPFYRKYDYGAVTVAEVGAVDQNARGGTLAAGYRIRPLITAGVTATFENLRYEDLARTDHNRYYTLFLRQQLARNWAWRAELTRNERHSTDGGVSSDENIVFFGVTYTRE
jgi:hypothetical protein